MFSGTMLPSDQYLLAAAIGIILCTISILALNKRRRMSFLQQFSSWIPGTDRGRRGSASKTPPRSLSPEKKVPSNAPPATNYKDVFPPSRREALSQAAVSLPAAEKKKLSGSELDQDNFKKNILPFTADYRKCGPFTYTPMQISIEEVRALGDFPDYATLGGVPLPDLYKEFEIGQALARPYRPFRWAYHQTMCKSSDQSSRVMATDIFQSANEIGNGLVA